MGYDATWTPKAGGTIQTGKVHFRNPTETAEINDREFDPHAWEMEYHIGTFPGLLEIIEDGGTEIVDIGGTTFYINEITTHFDGKTFRARLAPTNDDTND